VTKGRAEKWLYRALAKGRRERNSRSAGMLRELLLDPEQAALVSQQQGFALSRRG